MEIGEIGHSHLRVWPWAELGDGTEWKEQEDIRECCKDRRAEWKGIRRLDRVIEKRSDR